MPPPVGKTGNTLAREPRVTRSDSSLRLLVLNEFFFPDVCASSAVLTDHLPRIAALRPDWRITVLTGNRAWDRPDVTWPARDRLGSIDIVRVDRPAVGRTLWRRGVGFAGFHLGVMRAGRRLPRPDVIMASTAPPLGGRLGLKLARHFGCPLIYKVLDLYPDCAVALGVLSRRSPIAALWRRADTAGMRAAAAVVPISAGIARRIEVTRGLPPGRVRLIYDGFDPKRVRPLPPGAGAFRAECGLSDAFVVQYAGNMGLSHPFETILDAARRLTGGGASAARGRRIVFQFIGAGPGRAVIEREKAERPDCIQLLDYQPAERLCEVLAAADVALISQAEGMAELSLPFKLYGILAAGRPCVFVGPRESEIVSLFEETGCGVHVNQGDATVMTAALERLIGDPDLRAEMSCRARAVFEQRFTSDRAAEVWVALIEEVCESRV